MHPNYNQEPQMKKYAVSSGNDVPVKTTLVGEDKIAMEYEYDHDVIIRHTRKNREGYHNSQ